jgi:hypothetical protein
MQNRLSAIVFISVLCAAAPASSQVSTPAGSWINTARTMTVSVAPCVGNQATFCGILVRDNRPGPAANPPNHLLLRDLKADRQGWRGKANDGGTQLNLNLRLLNPSSLQVRFCFGFVCETENWARVQPGSGGAPVPPR